MVFLFLGLYLAYRDTNLENFIFELLRYKKAEIISGHRSRETQYNLYLYIKDFCRPFIYRKFEEGILERYIPSLEQGQTLGITVSASTGLVFWH